MKPQSIIIEPAHVSDASAIAALLREAELPYDDSAPHLAHFLVARDDRGAVVGAVGAEVVAPDALLRSLVVAPAQRGAGLGDELVRRLDAAAAVWGVQRWWLLTTTAEKFFTARGFVVAARGSAPEAIRRTGQFSGGCGSAAVCLTRERRAATAGTVDFDRAVTEFSARLRAFIRRRVRDDATADDLTQETLLKVFRSRAALRDGQRLEAWLYRIARTTLIDYYRRTKPTEELPEALAAEPADEIAKLREGVMAAMKRFLKELPEAYREPVRLAELEGLPFAKIALRNGLSLTAVKSRVRRGRALLKRKLQDCCRFEFDRQGKVIGWERRPQAKRCKC
jgi:RNA polymerase sigma factor (SigZ family)